MGRAVEKPFAGGTWSKAKFFGFLRSNLRKTSRKFPAKRQAEEACRRKLKVKIGNQVWEYQCAGCGHGYKRSEGNMHHITSAGSLKSFRDLPGFVKRLFCEADGYHFLCEECHDKIHKK
jgi:rubredoxin